MLILRSTYCFKWPSAHQKHYEVLHTAWTPVLPLCFNSKASDEDSETITTFLQPQPLDRAKRQKKKCKEREWERNISAEALRPAVPCEDKLLWYLSSVMIKFSYCEYLFQFHNTEINVIIFCRDCEEAAEEETVKVMLRPRWSSLWVYDCVCVLGDPQAQRRSLRRNINTTYK